MCFIMSHSHRVAVLAFFLCVVRRALASQGPLFSQLASRQAWSSSMHQSFPALSTKRINTLLSKSLEEVSTLKKKKTGFYYGIPETLIEPRPKQKQRRREPLSKIMGDTLDELRQMRREMEGLKREMAAMKWKLGVKDEEIPYHHDDPVSNLLARRKRQRDFDRIGMEVEQWAERFLFEEGGEEDGWNEVNCNKLVRNKLNKDGNIKAYLKWMKDSRGTHAEPCDDREYPCIKVYATINAPMENVCAYLADENRIPEYNDLVVAHKDLEEISPHSKICWGQTPQVLFIKPRDFVTYCHHRWLRDGSQVVVNQACEHPDCPGNKEEKEGQVCRARALRGANFISRDPDNPENKTRVAMLAHADPGGLPQWACKTAVNAVAPIEPFKLFHRIDKQSRQLDSTQIDKTKMVHSTLGRSSRPAGLSQLGYAAFWPNGGGLTEGVLHHGHPDHAEPPEHHHADAGES